MEGAKIIGIGEGASSVGGKIATLALGSCLAVILYDPSTKAGGMIHAMLPRSEGKISFKYIDPGIELLIKEIASKGANISKIEAGIVGGGTIFNLGGELTIGKRNIEAAKAALKQRGIPLAISEVDGKRGRSVVFDLDSGTIYVAVSKPPMLSACSVAERL